MKTKHIFYSKIEYNILVDLFKMEDFSKSLAYLLDNKIHNSLCVVPNKYSIVIENEHITIIIILYVGFEIEEYEILKSKKNVHIITLTDIIPRMVEFKNIQIKYIDKLTLLLAILATSENETIKKLNTLKNLNL